MFISALSVKMDGEQCMSGEPLALAEKDGLPYFYFPQWEKTGLIGHGFSTRSGGISCGSFAELNLGFKGGDDPHHVKENRKRFLNIWGKNERDLVCGEQIHGTKVYRVEKDNIKEAGGRDIALTDALITAERGAVLGAYSADCLPALFFDPDFPAVGVAHAGWKGTCAGILNIVVEAMSKAFNTIPSRLQVLTGPSIDTCCYEVGSEVLDTCSRFSWKDNLVFSPGIREGRPFFDLKQSNLNILTASGVKSENIFISRYCTLCRRDYFYSYRGSGGAGTGSLMGLIFLK